MTTENAGAENPYADKIFTISNILSLSRIVIVIPIIYFLDLGGNANPRYNLTAFVLMIIGALTDTFDGQLARKMNQITNFGKVIDPIADKIGMAAILLFLAFSRDDFPFWFIVVALVRDILIFSAALYVKKKHGYLFTSNMLGKITITVVGLMVTVYVVKDVFLIEGFYLFLLWLSTGLLAASFCVYTYRLWKFLVSAGPLQNDKQNL